MGFDVLIKVVGEKSKILSNADAGTPIRFGGKFHVPIIEGVEKEETKRVVFVSTGVGIGPCVGAVEEALKDKSFPPIELFACYRNDDEIVYGKYLDELVSENPGRVSYRAIISSESGRLSANEKNLKALASNDFGPNDTHYHLIGNGQMVNEFKAGLEKAGIPKDKVTIEMYFNYKATPNEDAINRIASALSKNSNVEALV